MPLPEGTQFTIHVVGDVTGQTWTGEFRAKPKLSFRDQITIDRVRRELLGPNQTGVNQEIEIQVRILSELSVRIIESPAWWKDSKNGTDLHDGNLLMEIYTQACKIEEEAFAKMKETAEKVKEELRQPPQP